MPSKFDFIRDNPPPSYAQRVYVSRLLQPPKSKGPGNPVRHVVTNSAQEGREAMRLLHPTWYAFVGFDAMEWIEAGHYWRRPVSDPKLFTIARRGDVTYPWPDRKYRIGSYNRLHLRSTNLPIFDVANPVIDPDRYGPFWDAAHRLSFHASTLPLCDGTGRRIHRDSSNPEHDPIAWGQRLRFERESKMA